MVSAIVWCFLWCTAWCIVKLSSTYATTAGADANPVCRAIPDAAAPASAACELGIPPTLKNIEESRAIITFRI